MSYGETHEYEEIRCSSCDFLIGFQEREITSNNNSGGIKLCCIYCHSERRFFRSEFGGSKIKDECIYGTIETDKSHYRRGLMHDRKIAIALWRELIEDPDVKFD